MTPGGWTARITPSAMPEGLAALAVALRNTGRWKALRSMWYAMSATGPTLNRLDSLGVQGLRGWMEREGGRTYPKRRSACRRLDTSSGWRWSAVSQVFRRQRATTDHRGGRISSATVRLQRRRWSAFLRLGVFWVLSFPCCAVGVFSFFWMLSGRRRRCASAFCNQSLDLTGSPPSRSGIGQRMNLLISGAGEHLQADREGAYLRRRRQDSRVGVLDWVMRPLVAVEEEYRLWAGAPTSG
ncbi:hypothetical protein C8Q79DRAFT_538152 [Trametes meyenii]|nr:hypothetical protein C8Q79DRAFT_538152 [Trametes meyenii]